MSCETGKEHHGWNLHSEQALLDERIGNLGHLFDVDAHPRGEVLISDTCPRRQACQHHFAPYSLRPGQVFRLLRAGKKGKRHCRVGSALASTRALLPAGAPLSTSIRLADGPTESRQTSIQEVWRAGKRIKGHPAGAG